MRYAKPHRRPVKMICAELKRFLPSVKNNLPAHITFTVISKPHCFKYIVNSTKDLKETKKEKEMYYFFSFFVAVEDLSLCEVRSQNTISWIVVVVYIYYFSRYTLGHQRDKVIIPVSVRLLAILLFISHNRMNEWILCIWIGISW